MVWNCNPLVIVPNAEKIRAGVLRDDLFTVVHEQFITDTARYADIVLPATTQIEATDVVAPWGHLWLGWNNAAIEPCGEAVSNSELFRRLAEAMGYTEPALFDDDMTAIRAVAARRRSSTSCAASDWCECRTPRTAGRSATACSRPPAARSSSSARHSSRWASRRCRRSSPPRRRPRLARWPSATRCS